LSLGVSFCSTAQPQQLIFDKYTTDNGLSNNNCNNIVQDEDGFIWIATMSGLNRFDGKDFVKYFSNGSPNQLPGNFINKMVCLPQHKIAVATNEGLAILDSRTGAVRQLIIPAADELKETTNAVADIVTDKRGNLIVGTNGGVYIFNAALKLIFRYDAYTVEDISKKRLLYIGGSALHLIPDGRVLIVGNFGFIYILNIEKKRLQNIKDISGSEFNLLRRWNGTLGYICGSNKYGQLFFIKFIRSIDSLFVVDLPHQISFTSTLPFSVEKEINWGSQIMLLNDSLLSVSANNHDGVYLFHFNSNTLAATFTRRILPGAFCRDIMLDKNNRTWVGSEEGVFKQSFSKALFNNIFPSTQISTSAGDKTVTDIIHYQSKYFINQYKVGTLVYNDSLHFIRNINFNKAGKSNWPWNISYYTKDTLLIATGAGALLLNTVDYTVKKFWQKDMPAVIDSNAITSSLVDSHQQLWMGISKGNGVFKINMSTHEWKYFSPKVADAIFKLRYPTSIAEDRNGNVWMSGAEGITRWNQQKQTFDTLIKELPGLNDVTPSWNYLTIDGDNNLWLLKADLILAKWNLNTQQLKFIRRPANIPPLIAETIYGPWENCLWIVTDKGLLSFNIFTEQFHLITKSDGLFDDYVNGTLYFDTATHHLFAGFNNVFSWFYPQDVLKEKNPVQTIITDIRKIGDSSSLAADSLLSFLIKTILSALLLRVSIIMTEKTILMRIVCLKTCPHLSSTSENKKP